jgi:hypothetical protein
VARRASDQPYAPAHVLFLVMCDGGRRLLLLFAPVAGAGTGGVRWSSAQLVLRSRSPFRVASIIALGLLRFSPAERSGTGNGFRVAHRRTGFARRAADASDLGSSAFITNVGRTEPGNCFTCNEVLALALRFSSSTITARRDHAVASAARPSAVHSGYPTRELPRIARARPPPATSARLPPQTQREPRVIHCRPLAPFRISSGPISAQRTSRA